jgi:hypothetical protein
MGAARIFKLATPYQAADLFLLKFAQSADVMTITHPSYAPRDLARTAHDAWTLSTISFTPLVAAPAGVTATPSGTGTGALRTYRYRVTAVDPATGEQSVASATASCSNYALSQADNIVNTVAWTNAAGRTWNVFKEQNGVYGWIGRAETNSFVDDNIRPDTTDTPPLTKDPFASNNWPGVVAYHEQRKFFSTSLANPQTIWATASGLYRNFNASSPIRDDDAMEFTIASLQVNEIRWLVPLGDLVVLTSGGEWVVKPGGDSDVLTPSSIVAKPQSYVGSAHVPPIIANNRVLFVQERGSFVRDLGYDFGSDGYVGQDLSILSAHLFESRYITDWAYAAEPFKIIWSCTSDGRLLGLTYVKDHEVYAWHQHETPGAFESVASIPEAGRDAPYFVVRRTIAGRTRRYIERLRPRQDLDIATAWYVDSGLGYLAGTPETTFGGLHHLEGETVTVLADGNLSTAAVSGGSITLGQAASTVIAGLPYTGVLETLPVSQLPGRRKSLAKVTLRVNRSRGLKWGPIAGPIYEHKDRFAEAPGQPVRLITEDIDLNLSGNWSLRGQMRIETTPGLPAGVLAVIPEAEAGG